MVTIWNFWFVVLLRPRAHASGYGSSPTNSVEVVVVVVVSRPFDILLGSREHGASPFARARTGNGSKLTTVTVTYTDKSTSTTGQQVGLLRAVRLVRGSRTGLFRALVKGSADLVTGMSLIATGFDRRGAIIAIRLHHVHSHAPLHALASSGGKLDSRCCFGNNNSSIFGTAIVLTILASSEHVVKVLTMDRNTKEEEG
jgi:hypothetical protein